MVPQLMPRSAWTSVPRPTADLVALTAPQGFAVHWPGPQPSDPQIGDPGPAGIATILEAERAYHVDHNGWTDIAYQLAVDQGGRVWDCRGIAYWCAANGDQALNQAWGALTLLLGPTEPPTPAMIQAVQWARSVLWLSRYPAATRVVGHRDLWQTDCPGPAAYTLVQDGTFTRPWHPQQEDDMTVFVAPDGDHQPGDGILAVTGAFKPREVQAVEWHQLAAHGATYTTIPRGDWQTLKSLPT